MRICFPLVFRLYAIAVFIDFSSAVGKTLAGEGLGGCIGIWVILNE